MKTVLLSFILACLSVLCYSQTIDPAETAERCPHPDYLNATISSPGTQRFEINFGSNGASDYTIITGTNDPNKPVACNIVSNIQPISTGSNIGQCYVAFQDQRSATPKFTVKRISTGTLKEFKFPLMRSLKGLAVTLAVNPPVVNFPLCSSSSLLYQMNSMTYKRTDNQNPFGSPIPWYEYLVPKGWTVAGQVSNGTTPITASINATITSDKVNAGANEIKIRGSQTGYLCDNSTSKPASGEWLVIPITRPTIKLTSGGSSTTTSVVCGYSNTKTFVLENANQASCITRYVWNLGPTINGWKYNGADAASTITINAAANNSITLTTYCDLAPSSNVSVTAYAGTEALGTYSMGVTYDKSLPSFGITGGPNFLCTSAPVTYTITPTSFPCNSILTWSVSQPGIVSITPNGTSVTVEPIADGSVELRATLTACGGSKIAAFAITVGRIAPVQSLTIDGVDPTSGTLCPAETHTLIAYPGVIEQDAWYEWTLPPGWTSNEDPSLPYTSVDYMHSVIPAGDGWIYVRRVTNCGYSDFYSVYVSFNPFCEGLYKISPNPATNNITVDGQKQKKNIKEIQILDKTGQVRRAAKFSNDLQKVNFNISGLAPDIYYIKIFDGKEWSSKPIRVH